MRWHGHRSESGGLAAAVQSFAGYVVVVTGGVFSTLVDDVAVVPVAGGVCSSYGPAVPSTPVDGCGGAWPMPCAAGVSVFDCGGWVMAGGAFW